MKILILNTYDQGGAGIAARRLQNALNQSGVQAKMLTAAAAGNRWPFYAERLSFLPFERDKSVRFSFSPANFGKNILDHPLVREADVLHLHWINQGFLSLEGIRRLSELGKPVVWTLHDMWAFTGGCHYSRGCNHFEQSCGNCPYLYKPSNNDLSHRIWSRKQRKYPPGIQFVTCSEWLAGVARSSGLLKGYPAVTSVPNPIDVTVFSVLNENQKRNFWLSKGINSNAPILLFAAMNVSEERKGFRFLQEAMGLLKSQHPDFQLEIVVIGKAQPELLAALPYPVHALGMIQDQGELARIYGASDVFVIPSLEDNLPNTVMESLSCGTPVAGFQTGGIPEMVGHLEQGFIAPQGDSQKLAEGIFWILEKADASVLRKQAREKVESHYANAIVAKQYCDIYQNLLNSR
jgi:glycosyltransferase involved in cell wall biosynthesis